LGEKADSPATENADSATEEQDESLSKRSDLNA
jgi:hypothetical protein